MSELFEANGLRSAGRVRWGSTISTSKPGVYIVSMSPDTSVADVSLREAPLDRQMLSRWIEAAPRMRLDNAAPTVDLLSDRLGDFWLPDESILYIGKATALGSRIGQYYRTPLGARRPHAGGHWIKTLSILEDTFVHFADCAEPEAAEQGLLSAFAASVSSATKRVLSDPEHPFPFANLEFPPGVRKRHGITKSRG